MGAANGVHNLSRDLGLLVREMILLSYPLKNKRQAEQWAFSDHLVYLEAGVILPASSGIWIRYQILILQPNRCSAVEKNVVIVQG